LVTGRIYKEKTTHEVKNSLGGLRIAPPRWKTSDKQTRDRVFGGQCESD